jgi:hypothetical protein
LFFEQGWVPLCDVLSTFKSEATRQEEEIWDSMKYSDAGKEEDRSKASLRGFAAGIRIFWEFCDAVPKVGILGPHGNVIRVSKTILDWADPKSVSTPFFDIHIGTLGSSNWIYEDGDEVDLFKNATLNFGPFAFCHIVFPQDFFEDFCNRTMLRGQYMIEAHQPTSFSESNVAKRIVEAFDNGEPVTKAWAEANVAGSLSGRSFIRAWGRAVDMREALSRPGRRTLK